MHEVRVGARAEQLRVAVGKVAVAAPELGDLGRTDEREVHRPEEDHLPLATVRLVRDRLELFTLLQAHDRLELELRKAISNRQHLSSSNFEHKQS
jgi:hypothetical protein